MSQAMFDEARFDDSDEAAVVMSSFACRVCLMAADLVILTGGPGDRVASSHCPGCETRNVVALTDAQAHQVRTIQRGSAFVHFAPEYW